MTERRRRIATRRANMGAMLLLVLAAGVLWAKPMGLLFWARIRILTNIPRTAIADDPAALVADASPRSATREAALDPTTIELPQRPSRSPFAPISSDNPRH